MLMTLSTAAAITGTVAWFTASNTVNISGMQIQAEAEEGIVVSNEGKAAWGTEATASHNGAGSTYVPTSTSELTTWYHGLSNSVNDGQSGVSYTTLTVTATNGIGAATVGDATKNVYLLNSFYIQSSSPNAITGQDIYLKDLTVTGASVSTELNKALRVGILHDTTATIFAPITGATANYTVHDGNDVAAVTDTTGTSAVVGSNVSIPAYVAAGTNALEFKVFIYFEGEDAACKSANITATLDTLALTFKFGNKEHA